MSARDTLGDQFGENKKQGMISLDLPHGVIPTVPGDVENRHITVTYLGSDVDDETHRKALVAAQRVAAQTPPLRGTVGGRGTFPATEHSDGKTPVYAVPDIPGIHELHNQFTDLEQSSFSEYHPHATIAYVGDGEPLPPPIDKTPVEFRTLSVHHGDKVTRFPFGGSR